MIYLYGKDLEKLNVVVDFFGSEDIVGEGSEGVREGFFVVEFIVFLNIFFKGLFGKMVK